MTIPGTSLDLWHLLLWQWKLIFYVTMFIPFIGWLLRLAALWMVFDASAIVYREMTQRGELGKGLLWAICCFIWPLTLILWFRLYGDSPLQAVEAHDAGLPANPYDRPQSWQQQTFDKEPRDFVDDYGTPEPLHAAARRRAQQASRPAESRHATAWESPRPDPSRDPLANDADPEVGELGKDDYQPRADLKTKWARPQKVEKDDSLPLEPWKTLGA